MYLCRVVVILFYSISMTDLFKKVEIFYNVMSFDYKI